MGQVHLRGPARINANMTPMIDVTFLLIVFFVLVSQIVEVENVPLALPELPDPRTERPADEQRAVINVVPGLGGTALAYRLGGRDFGVDDSGRAALTAELTSLLTRSPALRVNLRADRSTEYNWIQPVLRAVSSAAAAVPDGNAAPRVNLLVIPEDAR